MQFDKNTLSATHLLEFLEQFVIEASLIWLKNKKALNRFDESVPFKLTVKQIFKGYLASTFAQLSRKPTVRLNTNLSAD